MVFSTILFLFRFLPITLALYYLCTRQAEKPGAVCVQPGVLFLGRGEILPGDGCAHPDQLFLRPCNGKVRSKPQNAAAVFDRFHRGQPSMLVFFKYTNFLIGTVNGLFGLSIGLIEAATVLPLGISFYTFQTMSYSIDVYRRDVNAEHNIIDFGAYVVMFPQLIAGPIVNTATWPPSCMFTSTATAWPRSKRASACSCSVWPKSSHCRHREPFVVRYHRRVERRRAGHRRRGHCQRQHSPGVAGGCLPIPLQLYFDFSGYSLMGIGMGKCWGSISP